MDIWGTYVKEASLSIGRALANTGVPRYVGLALLLIEANGNFSFTVTATDSAGCVGSQPFNLLVNPAGCPPIGIAPASLSALRIGVPFSQVFTGSGGTAPYNFALTAGALPQGLLLNPLTGVLSGTPMNIGPYSFRITATDALGCFTSATYAGQIVGAPVSVPLLGLPGLLLMALLVGLAGWIGLRR